MGENTGRDGSPNRPNCEPRRSDLIFDADGLSPAALERKHRLERDPSCRADPMRYLPGMEEIESDVKDRVRAAMAAYDPGRYSAADVRRALERDRRTEEDLRALLSPAAAPFLERMAERAREETVRLFSNTVYIFTPLFVPVAQALGVDMIHLGVVMIVNLAIGLFTPPVGVNLYVACGVANVDLKQISKSVIPLLIASLVVLLIITYIPGISTVFTS